MTAVLHQRLGELFIEFNIITKIQRDQALAMQEKTHERLGEILLRLGFVTEAELMRVLGTQFGLMAVSLTELKIVPDIIRLIPQSFAQRYTLIPLKKVAGKLTVALADPSDFYAIDDVRTITGLDIEPVIAAEKEILRAIHEAYGMQALVSKVANMPRPEDLNKMDDVQRADDAPVIHMVNAMIQQAIEGRASDIHVEPMDQVLRVRFRVDGVLREIFSLPLKTHALIISRIKIMSALDIAEKRVPQDGRIQYKDGQQSVDLRVSVLPTIHGEKIVMRILDQRAVQLDIQQLGFSADNFSIFQRIYRQSYGMVLITGPTGSGKTTTLYATLTALNTICQNIITIEDPVEYRLPGINQVQVNPKAGLDFAVGLRSILRQDPNIIMVGEIRDSETANIAIRAALTGHLVFATLHTNDSAGAIARLVDMGVEPFLVASSVLGILAQRLVRTICPHCKMRYSPEKNSLECGFLARHDQAGIVLYKGSGCSYCGGTGYQGRMAIHEILPLSPELRARIVDRTGTETLKYLAMKQGMKTMDEDGIQKIFQGKTTSEEVMRVAYAAG